MRLCQNVFCLVDDNQMPVLKVYVCPASLRILPVLKCAYTLPLSKSGVANLHMICPQEDPLIVVSLRIFLPTLLLNKEKELVPVICPMALGFSQEALLLWISSILGFLFWVF